MYKHYSLSRFFFFFFFFCTALLDVEQKQNILFCGAICHLLTVFASDRVQYNLVDPLAHLSPNVNVESLFIMNCLDTFTTDRTMETLS